MLHLLIQIQYSPSNWYEAKFLCKMLDFWGWKHLYECICDHIFSWAINEVKGAIFNDSTEKVELNVNMFGFSQPWDEATVMNKSILWDGMAILSHMAICIHIFSLLLKYRKVTRPGIEPRIFWTYTRCSNQLSYLALGFNQLILYLCNCQPKDTYSAISYMPDWPCDQDMTRLVNLETMWQII